MRKPVAASFCLTSQCWPAQKHTVDWSAKDNVVHTVEAADYEFTKEDLVVSTSVELAFCTLWTVWDLG